MAPTTRSMSLGTRNHKAEQAVESAEERKYMCEVKGCYRTYGTQSEWGRHKWKHVPEHLLPTCPFVDSLGQRCPQPYWGRASCIKLHWDNNHSEAGPFPSDFEWPTLRQLANNLSLGDDTPHSTARTNHRSSAAPNFDQIAEHERTKSDYFSQRMPYFTQFPVDPRYFPAAQGYYSPDTIHEELSPPNTPPSNTYSPNINQDSHYAPVYSTSDNGGLILVPGPLQELYKRNLPPCSTSGNSGGEE